MNVSAVNGGPGEAFALWQHLANAGLIEGTYTGLSGSLGTINTELGSNAPRSRIAKAGYLIRLWSYSGVGIHGFVMPSQNWLFFGSASSGAYTYYAALRPEEAWNIETKMDDGRPGTGTIMNWKSTSTYVTDCVTTDVASTAEYSLSNDAIACPLLIKLGF